MPERFTEIPEGTSLTRRSDERRCVLLDHVWASVGGIRVVPDEIDDLIDEVRALTSAGQHTAWYIGPSSEPADLRDQLARRGFRPTTDGPSELRALLLTTEPEGPSDVEVCPIETYEQFLAAREMSWDAFGISEERRTNERPATRRWYDDMVRTGLPVYLAVYDGERIAGTAVAIPSPRGVLLGGGSVAAWARGRGIYRALVRARWEYATRRGTPALVTHANPATSYPILMRLGFEEVGTIWRMVDGRATDAATRSR